MKISILTVTKNNKAELLRAIECVRSQSYKDVEHIIVDGGSTDGTVEILRAAAQVRQTQRDKNGAVILNGMKDLPSPLDSSPTAQNDTQPTTLPQADYSLHTISEADTGIYDAINKGIKLATGDVIGLLHSDDLYADENVIARYAEVFAGDSFVSTKVPPQNDSEKVDAVYSDLVYVIAKLKDKGQKSKGSREQSEEKLTTDYSLLTTNYSIIRNWKAGDPSTEFIPEKARLRMTKWLKLGWMPPHPTLFIRKEIFEKYGLYETSFKIAADYDMILRLFYKHKITAHYLPLTTYVMSLGGASNKSVNNILLKSKEDLLALKLNNLPHPLITLISKNFRKLPQFMIRDLS